jgi:hypothetical protein
VKRKATAPDGEIAELSMETITSWDWELKALNCENGKNGLTGWNGEMGDCSKNTGYIGVLDRVVRTVCELRRWIV